MRRFSQVVFRAKRISLCNHADLFLGLKPNIIADVIDKMDIVPAFLLKIRQLSTCSTLESALVYDSHTWQMIFGAGIALLVMMSTLSAAILYLFT